MAPLYSTLFIYFSHFGIMVLKRGTALALVVRFLFSSKSIHCFFLIIWFDRCASLLLASLASPALFSRIFSGVFPSYLKQIFTALESDLMYTIIVS